MINKNDNFFLTKCFNLASEAYENNEIPVGAVIVNENNIIVSEEINSTKKDLSRLYHAELKALHSAKKVYENKLMNKCTLYTNLEPCIMCLSAAITCGIHKIVFSLNSNELSGLNFFKDSNLIENKILIIKKNYLENENKKMLLDFFKQKR